MKKLIIIGICVVLVGAVGLRIIPQLLQNAAVPTSAPADSGSQTPDGAALSFEAAKQLALDRVPGAGDRNIELELDHDDGYLIYEGEIHYNHMEYEFEIDASTGNFIKWSEDYND